MNNQHDWITISYRYSDAKYCYVVNPGYLEENSKNLFKLGMMLDIDFDTYEEAKKNLNEYDNWWQRQYQAMMLSFYEGLYGKIVDENWTIDETIRFIDDRMTELTKEIEQ